MATDSVADFSNLNNVNTINSVNVDSNFVSSLLSNTVIECGRSNYGIVLSMSWVDYHHYTTMNNTIQELNNLQIRLREELDSQQTYSRQLEEGNSNIFKELNALKQLYELQLTTNKTLTNSIVDKDKIINKNAEILTEKDKMIQSLQDELKQIEEE